MAKKERALSAESERALKMLKEKGELTIADMKELGFDNVNSSHLTALKNRGLVQSEQVEKLVVSTVKRKVQLYKAVEVAETETETGE